MKCDWFGRADRAKQQGTDLRKPPWAGGKYGSSRPGGTSQCLSLTTARHHTLAWAGRSLSLPGLLETIPSICAFHSALLWTQLPPLSLNPWEMPSNPRLRCARLLPFQAAYRKSSGFPLKTRSSLRVCRAGSGPGPRAAPWAQSLMRRSWCSPIEVDGEAPVHPGENKRVGLGKSFPLM